MIIDLTEQAAMRRCLIDLWEQFGVFERSGAFASKLHAGGVSALEDCEQLLFGTRGQGHKVGELPLFACRYCGSIKGVRRTETAPDPRCVECGEVELRDWREIRYRLRGNANG